MASVIIPKATDFASEGRLAARQQQFFMVLVSQTDCPYCHLIKEEIIRPMILAKDFADRLLIREIYIDEGEMLIDFHGQTVATADFARRYGVALTPTLIFLDARGRELTKKMVGVNTMEMYYYYVEQSIRAALKKLGWESAA